MCTENAILTTVPNNAVILDAVCVQNNKEQAILISGFKKNNEKQDNSLNIGKLFFVLSK